ncbi:hypothetical protein UFOVP328_6 [uncultured Caudovirales phage]|uniref:Uncharacterized protein n=1 Tax=uncultured Caudovirales phage TaxID=2100421 RepID=A0A6J5LS59_9CAUD|nr:hypothetical protein UFOVP328_6 [uncultured Caudovirales phage]
MSNEHKSLSSKLLSYSKHSGVSVVVTLNPLWWKLRPWSRRETTEWAGPDERVYAVGWLFLTVRIFIDNGEW